MLRSRGAVCGVGAVATASLVLLLVAFAFGGSVVAAQDVEDTFDLGIVAVNCDIQAPQNITVAEEGCSPAEGVVFTATILNGDAVGSCTAQVADVESPTTAGCSIEVPYGATLVVNEDPSTVLAGYEIMRNAQEFTAPDGPPTGMVGGVTFVNLLQQDDTSAPEQGDEVPTEEDAPAANDEQIVNEGGLPRTGAGVQQSADVDSLAAIAVAGTVAVVAAAGAIAMRFGIRKQ